MPLMHGTSATAESLVKQNTTKTARVKLIFGTLKRCFWFVNSWISRHYFSAEFKIINNTVVCITSIVSFTVYTHLYCIAYIMLYVVISK